MLEKNNMGIDQKFTSILKLLNDLHSEFGFDVEDLRKTLITNDGLVRFEEPPTDLVIRKYKDDEIAVLSYLGLLNTVLYTFTGKRIAINIDPETKKLVNFIKYEEQQ